MDSVCPCPWSTAGFGLLPCPAGVTLQHPPSFGAGYCSHGRCECVGGSVSSPRARCGSLRAPSRPLHVLFGGGAPQDTPLGVAQPRPVSPAHLPLRRSPPSRQGALWASLASGASRHLPLSFRGCRRHGESRSHHPPPSSGRARAPAVRSGGGNRRGPGREAVGGGGGRDGRGEGGLGRGALGLGSAEPDRRPARPPRVGTRPDEDGEEGGAGDH